MASETKVGGQVAKRISSAAVVGLASDAMEAGAILHVADRGDWPGATYTAGRCARTGAWLLVIYRGGPGDEDRLSYSAEDLARRLLLTYAGKRNLLAAARAVSS